MIALMSMCFRNRSRLSHSARLRFVPLNHRPLCCPHGLQFAHAPLPTITIKLNHQTLSRFVVNLPEVGDHSPRAGLMERPLQAKHAFPAGHVG